MTDIDEFLAALPLREKLLTKHLRTLILESDPRIQEVFSYGVPYYKHNRRICFIWPASQIPCGYERPVREEVSLGFCYGSLLSNEQGILLKENRKQVCVVRFRQIADINDVTIREIVQEAIMVDDSFAKTKTKKTRS